MTIQFFPMIRKQPIFTQKFMAFLPSLFGMARTTKQIEITKIVIGLFYISTLIINMINIKSFRSIFVNNKTFLAGIIEIFNNLYTWSAKTIKLLIQFSPSSFFSKQFRLILQRSIIFTNSFLIIHMGLQTYYHRKGVM